MLQQKRLSIVILADGNYPTAKYPLSLLRDADYIICCYASVLKLKDIAPNYIVGDMDTLPAEYKAQYRDIIVQSSCQETNDQTKAFRWVLDNLSNVGSIYILGATGEREDHTIGNISLLTEYARSYDLDAMGITLEMVSDYSTIFAITDTCEMECGEGRKVSIFSPDNSLRIKSQGLEWPTDDVVFDNWWKATLNRASQDNVRLEFSHKSIALIMLN